MTMLPITESGMTFGPYPDGYCFWIEKSATYRSIQQDVLISEFVLLRLKKDLSPVVWIIEAKSSSPHPETKLNFDQFIQEIRDKLINTLSLLLAMLMGRHPAFAAELPESFKSLDFSSTGFCLVLVIRGHQESWLAPLQDALVKALRATVKIWALSPNSVVVINDSLARRYGLILSGTE